MPSRGRICRPAGAREMARDPANFAAAALCIRATLRSSITKLVKNLPGAMNAWKGGGVDHLATSSVSTIIPRLCRPGAVAINVARHETDMVAYVLTDWP